MTTPTSRPARESTSALDNRRGPAAAPTNGHTASNGADTGEISDQAEATAAQADAPTAAPASGPPAAASATVAAPTAAPPATAPHPGTPSHPHHARHRTANDPVIRAGSRPKRKRRRLLLLFPILLIVLVASGTLGYRYWYESTYFVSTDNASVTGDLVQVGSLNAGRIVATRVDVGAQVRQGQEIAVVALPQEMGGTTAGAAPRMGVTGNADTLVPVYAPLTGIVAARTGYVGGTVAAGQPIYALVDPKQVWVKANIEEGSAWRVAVGQPVAVHVDALNADFIGRVEAITPASAATFSLLPSGNVSGNFTKVTQYVPVKISVNAGGAVLPLGTSVEVKIQIRQPTEEFPLPWQP
jgi:hypothetical protein